MSEKPTVADGLVVAIHFTLKTQDGTDIDATDPNDPLPYIQGSESLPPALEKALEGATVGEKRSVPLTAAEAYGERDESKVTAIPNDQLPDDFDPPVGASFLADINDETVEFHVLQKEDNSLIVDANHPLAGMDVTFEVEIIAIREATEDEKAHGHPHGLHGDEAHHH